MTRISILIIIILLLAFEVQSQTLNEYLVVAAENNPGLKGKYLEYQAMLERVPQVGSLPDPQLSFGYFILPVETRVGPQQMKFSVSQMFPWFGSLGAKKEAATMAAKAKFESFESAKNLLYYQVTVAYYQLWQLNQQLVLQQENLDILKSYESLATTKYENGKVGLVDVIRVQMQIDEAQTEIEIKQLQLAPLNTRFNTLLNRNVDAEVNMPLSLEATAPLETAVVDSLFQDNPLLLELDLKAKMFQQNLLIAKKTGMPMFGVGLDYAIVKKRTDMEVPNNGQNILMPMVTVSLPIYRKKYTAIRHEAQFQFDAIEAGKKDLLNNLTSEYEMATWQYKQATSRLDLYARQMTKSESALNILTTSYSSNNRDFEEVLRMQQQIIKYRLEIIVAETDAKIAGAKINYLISK